MIIIIIIKKNFFFFRLMVILIKTLKDELKKLQKSPRNSISNDSGSNSPVKSPYIVNRQQSLHTNPNLLIKSQSEAFSPAVLQLHSNKSSNSELYTMDDINVEYLKAVLFRFFEFKDKKVSNNRTIIYKYV